MNLDSTLDALEPSGWADPDDGTPMVARIRSLGRVPLRKLSAGDLRLLLGQRRAVRTILPLALEVLEADPFVEGDYYPGDLLMAALRAGGTDPRVRGLAAAAIRRLHELDEVDRLTLERELRTAAAQTVTHPISVLAAINTAELLLPGTPAPDGETDPRWQAIIKIAEFIESEPEAVWEFAARWGSHDQEDLRGAIATVVLEHLLEHHFDLLFPRVEALAQRNANFARTVSLCAKFGQSKHVANAPRLDRLLAEIAAGRG